MKILILSFAALFQSLTAQYRPIYENCGLSEQLDYLTFIRAMARFQSAKSNVPIYTIIDMVETAENVWSDSCVCAMTDHDIKA